MSFIIEPRRDARNQGLSDGRYGYPIDTGDWSGGDRQAMTESAEPIEVSYGGKTMMLHLVQAKSRWELSSDDFERRYTTFPGGLGADEARERAWEFMRGYVLGLGDGEASGRLALQLDLKRLLGLASA